jgi:hypothetical protein
MLDGEHHEAVFGVDVELLANAVAVVFYGAVADKELLGDLFARFALGDQPENPQLSWC